MKSYTRSKIRTATNFVQKIRNWPTAWGLKLHPSKGALRLLEFRDGLCIVVRSGTRDEDVMHELLFADGYSRGLSHISKMPENSFVLDLGANIGLFSLLAARTHPTVRIFAYEPGPENINLFRMNVLANPELEGRITVIPKGISGSPGKASWTFNPDNPGGSGLYGKGPRTVEVEVMSLQQVIEEHPGQSLFVKMDIEGSEFEVIRATPASSWEPVQALTFELHDDPQGVMPSDAFLATLRGFGFQIEKEDVVSYYAYRK